MGSHAYNQDQGEAGFITLKRSASDYIHTGAVWVLVASILLILMAGGLAYLLMPPYIDSASSTHKAEESCFMLGGVPRYSWFNQGFIGCDFPPMKGK